MPKVLGFQLKDVSKPVLVPCKSFEIPSTFPESGRITAKNQKGEQVCDCPCEAVTMWWVVSDDDDVPTVESPVLGTRKQ